MIDIILSRVREMSKVQRFQALQLQGAFSFLFCSFYNDIKVNVTPLFWVVMNMNMHVCAFRRLDLYLLLVASALYENPIGSKVDHMRIQENQVLLSSVWDWDNKR